MVRVYFDGVPVHVPIEWKELGVTVSTDHVNQLITIEYNETFTFIKDAFEFLYSRINASCALIDVRIEMQCADEWNDIINGVIFIGDVTFNELRCEASVTIQDDGYSARVQNNKNLPINLISETTKNGETITAATHSLITLFNPVNGLYSFPRETFSIHSCFKYAIAWMTDQKVGFQSDYFGSGEGAKSSVLSGYDLRNGDNFLNSVGQPPSYTFTELYNTFRRLHNLGMGYKRDSNNKPVLVIEELAYFRGADVILDLDDVHETELDFVAELLFGRISVGSKITGPWECDGGNTRCSAENNLIYFGFEQEDFAFTGECNKDLALDLTIGDKFIVDTSTIEDVLLYGNESYDNANFIIRWDYNPSPFREAVQVDLLGTGNWWYNEYYTNKEVIARYQDYLFGSILLFGLIYDIHLFKATGSAFSPVFLPQQFPTQLNYLPPQDAIVYDPDGVYSLDPVNEFRPVDEGVYKLWAGVSISYDSMSSSSLVTVTGYFVLEQFNQAGTLVATHNSLLQFNFFTGGSNLFFIDREFDWITMEAGDYLIWSIEFWQDFDPGIEQAIIQFNLPGAGDQYIECRESRVIVRDGIPTSGSDRRIIRTSTAEYPIPWSDMKSYLSDTTKRLRIRNERIDRTGWNDSVTHNFITGKSEVQILND